MRRKHLAIGFALIVLSAAAAVAILPQNGADLRDKLSFLPTELWSLSGNGQPLSGNPGGPPRNPPTSQRDPFGAIDLPIDTSKIYVADFNDDPVSEDPASEPFGGLHTAKGAAPKSTGAETTNGTTDGDLSILPGGGYSAAFGGTNGGFTVAASNENPTERGPTSGNNGDGSTGGGDGTENGGNPNGNPGDTNGNKPPVIETNLTETPVIAIAEPAPLSLLLAGGLALVLARRRAKRRAAR